MEGRTANSSPSCNSLEANVACYALVSHGQTEMHPDCILFSCCSPTSSACSLTVSTSACCSLMVSASAAASWVHLLVITHTQYIVPGIISTKIARHYCIPSLQISHFCYIRTHTECIDVCMLTRECVRCRGVPFCSHF